MMEYSFALSALLLWMPTGFFLATSVLGVFAETGTKRMLSFYALMLVGAVLGIIVGEAMNFFFDTTVGIGCGLISGGIIGVLVGSASCGLLTKESQTVEEQVFVLGMIVAGIIGATSGALAGAKNHQSLFVFLAFILAVELLSFTIAQFVRFVRNLTETFKVMVGW